MAPGAAWEPPPLDMAGVEARRKRNRPPMEFLMSLSRIEENIQNISDPASTKGLPAMFGVLQKAPLENPEDGWRENLKTYEEFLEKMLARWDTLEPSAIEFYRSRIEGLRPMLERAIDERMRAKAAAEMGAAAAAAAAAAAPTEGSSTAAASPIPAVSAQDPPSEQPGQADATAPAMGSPPATRGVAPLGDVPSVDSGKVAPATAVGGGAPDAKPAIPWRRRGGGNPSSAAATAASRQAIEADLVNIGTGMLGTVTNISKTVKRDNDVLGKISDDMHGRLDKVTGQTATGKQMMRSGQLGFMCTMVMLVTSVIIFFMMIPFIIFT